MKIISIDKYKYIVGLSINDNENFQAYYIKDKEAESINKVVNDYFDTYPISEIKGGQLNINTTFINISDIKTV